VTGLDLVRDGERVADRDRVAVGRAPVRDVAGGRGVWGAKTRSRC
jgi:hypothetical protein